MAPRTTPSARQERVGTELRKMRDSAGRTTAEAAALFGFARTKITQIEKGQYPISAERVRMLASEFQEGDAAFVEALAAMAEERHKGWWEDFRGSVPVGFLDIAEMEHFARGMRTYQVSHVPGAMQTEAYARAIFGELYPPLPPRLIEARLEHRLQRTALMMREGAQPYSALVHEAALHMLFGGRGAAKQQLDKLLEFSELPHVTLRVISFSSDGFIGAGQGVFYAEGPVPRLDTVQLDAVGGPAFLHEQKHLKNYRHMIDVMTERSLTESQSRDAIRLIKKEL
ncbi:helix-turn-helix transcriptional regulator [Kitasatospora cathayae]|uniref:Helix-turn-helix transcriptional regulator n=2 Tax=Kitasatospora cathayae TaxID=3004092 RepID=A0ABY7Q7U5_9ACTN|nr:helix-turn-helix transcriptional regulator [Kitasatospora sp. HUAS 3-15]WBP88692.1 helix-turn-helix transcriptional regulator [Kitasatospora sp. HUAS 3-15]